MLLGQRAGLLKSNVRRLLGIIPGPFLLVSRVMGMCLPEAWRVLLERITLSITKTIKSNSHLNGKLTRMISYNLSGNSYTIKITYIFTK